MTDPAPGARRLPPRRRVTVVGVERPTPRVVRLTVRGDDLAGFATDGPAAHVKLILPPPGHLEVVLPTYAEDGTPIFAPGAPRPFLRTYTPLQFDADRRELAIEVLLHGAGPASRWAAQAEVGHQIVVAGPRGGYSVDPSAEDFLLLADDTALPAASMVLAALPSGARARVVAEVVDADEERDLPGDAAVVWCHRGEDPSRAGQALERQLATTELDPGTRVWVACEAGAMRRLRRSLLGERGVRVEHLVTRGYWKLGEGDHPDGDYGVDVQP